MRRRALLVAGGLGGATAPARAQDHEREARWAEQTRATLVAGEAVEIAQRGGHRFLALHLEPEGRAARGAAIVAHGRGWSPDFELYGTLRTRLADAGYATLSIQLPVLPSTAKIGDYLPTFPDAAERFALAAEWLRARGHRDIAIVSHSLGATMANHYLIRHPDSPVRAWVFISIINGLVDMFRLDIPVLDVFGAKDWDITIGGADERRAQIARIAGSRQVVIAGAEHFFEGQERELVAAIASFLDGAFARGGR